jgi:hypothetical protein
VSDDLFLLDGRAYSWRQLCELRRLQLEEQRAKRARQLVLFELKHDYRPATEATAAGRYREPSLFTLPSPPT